MDFFNQTTAQLRELFASMTPGARVTAGLLLAVVVVSLGFLFQQATAGPDEYLFGGEAIDRGRLPRMEAAMSSAGIAYTTEGTRIKVPRSDKNAAIAAIADAGELPPEFHRIMDDAINGGGMFDFRDVKLQRMRAAREEQVSKVLGEFPWVDRAHVIYNVRQVSGLRSNRHATAAVSIRPAVSELITSKRMRTVKDYVSKACDVPLDQVTVTDLSGKSSESGAGISAEDFDHPLYRLKALEEQKIRSALMNQLSFIPGVNVEVNARLDDISEQRTVRVKPDEQPVALSKKTTFEDDERAVGVAGDRVGVEANGPAAAGRDEALARQDTTKRTYETTDSDSVVGTQTTETITAGFALKEAEASIKIPMSYVKAAYLEENRNPDGTVPDQIDPNALDQVRGKVQKNVEDLVQPLLPKLALGENEYKQVKVIFVTELPQEELPEPSLAANALAWTGQYGNTLAMAGLAVFSLVMLRSMVTSSGKEAAPPHLPSLQLDGESLPDNFGGGVGEEDEQQRPKLKLKKADSLKDDLTDMVSTDPDAAAAILKAWINNNNSSNNAA